MRVSAVPEWRRAAMRRTLCLRSRSNGHRERQELKMSPGSARVDEHSPMSADRSLPKLGFSERLCLALAAVSGRFLHFDEAEDINEEYGEWYFDYEVEKASRFGQQFIHRPDYAGRSVLEIGCGYGGMLAYVADKGAKTAAGIDVDPERVNLGRRRLGDRAELRVADASALPYPDSSFDIIICDSVLEHVHDLHATLSEVHRTLRPGGTFYAIWGNSWLSPNGPHHLKILPLPWRTFYFRTERL
jgi:SAM-dependent methyltransferase